MPFGTVHEVRLDFGTGILRGTFQFRVQFLLGDTNEEPRAEDAERDRVAAFFATPSWRNAGSGSPGACSDETMKMEFSDAKRVINQGQWLAQEIAKAVNPENRRHGDG